MERNYVKWDMHGFFNMDLDDNKKYAVEHELIESIYIEVTKGNSLVTSIYMLSSIQFNLKEGVYFEDHQKKIVKYLEELCFNIIVYETCKIERPYCTLNMYSKKNGLVLHDSLRMTDGIFFSTKKPAEIFYDNITKHSTDLKKNPIFYDEFFRILKTPSSIQQYIRLYEMFKELLGIKNQKEVFNFFKEEEKKYPKVKFITSRKKIKKEFLEDQFTYFRNELAHPDEFESRDWEAQANQYKFELLKIINDIIMNS